MANKRDSSAQKRARENRAQREALAARTKAAATPRPSRVAPAAGGVTAKGGRGAKATKGAAAPAASGKRVGRFGAPGEARPPRRPRLGDTPVVVEELEGSFIRRVMQVPGGSQVAMALAISVLSAFFAVSQKTIAPEGKTLSKTVKPTRTLIDALGAPQAIGLVAIPVVLIAIGVALGLSPRRRRVWLVVTMLLGLLVVGAGVVFFYFLFPLGLMGYALFRASKVEGPQPLLRRPGRGTRDDADEIDESVDGSVAG